MTLNLSMPVTHELKPRITVIGVGGAGGNAVNNMITSHLEGVDFVVANTDAQALSQSLTDRRIQLGAHVTNGLGAGARPERGRAAAEETLDEILDQLDGSNMVFITAGMGGGTGTGAAPVIAQAIKERDILTVGVVSKPFHFEGAHRMRVADSGIEELQRYVDTLIVIPNQNLFRLATERTTFHEAFKMADNVLHMGVRGVTDLMVMPGLINLDFADIRTVMSEMGKAMMGTGEAEGDSRALTAAEEAISNPLLDDVSMVGARGVLINITGGMDITLHEVEEAANRVRDEVDPSANIIFGSTLDETLEGKIRVSVVATGIDAGEPLHNAQSQSAAQTGGGFNFRLSAKAPQEAPSFPNRARLRPAAQLEEARAESEARDKAKAMPHPNSPDAGPPQKVEIGRQHDGGRRGVFVAPQPIEPNSSRRPFEPAPISEGGNGIFSRISQTFRSTPKREELQPEARELETVGTGSEREEDLETPAYMRR
ncbi:MAG: cell division protein FtsZ [Geminicoccaceae bacterium]